ncbi:MAG: hypothetical protein LBK99_15740, partial [Opitutaceae bacterium]|nr:hypothetical protein [Opitutaceae bacterium]
MHTILRSLPALLLATIAHSTLPAFADVASDGASTLLEETFANCPPGNYNGNPAAGPGKIKTWRGPVENLFGSFEIIEASGLPAPLLSALAIRDTAGTRDQAPSLVLTWPPVDAGAPGSVVVEFHYKILPPSTDVPGKPRHYRADILAGGAWSKAICNVILEQGQIRLHDGQKASSLGPCKAGQWQSLRLEVDTSARTFNLSIDGRLLANRLPWINPGNPAFASLTIRADMSPTDRNGDPVLLLANLK